MYTANCPICGAKDAIKYQDNEKKLHCSSCRYIFDLEADKPSISIDEYIKLQKQALLNTATEGYQNYGRGAVVIDVREWPPMVKRYYFPDKLARLTIGWPDDEIQDMVETYIPESEIVVYIYDHDAENSEWRKLWVGPGGKG